MARLTELPPEECWALIDGPTMGRVGWTTPEGPTVLPVNYALDGATLWIRTSAYSELAQEVDESKIALLVDEIDPATHVGWTVLLRGTAHATYRADLVPEAARDLQTWPEGARPIWLHLAPEHVTGRRLT